MAEPHHYSKEDILQAVTDVKNGTLTMYQAQKKYNVPKTTLRTKLSGNRNKKHGRETLLSADLENQLAQWVHLSAKSGYPKTSKEILEAARQLAVLDENTFKNGVPTTGWLKGYALKICVEPSQFHCRLQFFFLSGVVF